MTESSTLTGPTPPTTRIEGAARLSVLDGWRAVSILLVLSAHMLPLGPKSLALNLTAAAAGMSLFFTLSGFLITHTLYKHPDVGSFIVRRLCRIVPLAYLGTIFYLALQGKPWPFYAAHFLFIENYDHAHLTPLAGHFWSLCVEMHFYAFVALLTFCFGVKGLRILPFVALGITLNRVREGQYINIMTHLRVDEILAGALLALIWHDAFGRAGRWARAGLQAAPAAVWLVLFALSCHPRTGFWQYPRAYLASAVVGHTLLTKRDLQPWLVNRKTRYIAEISYALYVIHPATTAGWLGSGDTLVKYSKRPLSFALTFGLAHLSTFRFERPFIAWGKTLTRRGVHRGHPDPTRLESGRDADGGA